MRAATVVFVVLLFGTSLADASPPKKPVPSVDTTRVLAALKKKGWTPKKFAESTRKFNELHGTGGPLLWDFKVGA